jgi:hypothetical protein
MPRYRVRLEDPNSEHFRVTYISAETEEEAVSKVVTIDQGLVADPEYAQNEPYEVAEVIVRGEEKSATKAAGPQGDDA